METHIEGSEPATMCSTALTLKGRSMVMVKDKKNLNDNKSPISFYSCGCSKNLRMALYCNFMCEVLESQVC